MGATDCFHSDFDVGNGLCIKSVFYTDIPVLQGAMLRKPVIRA
jgi:hypothetical protein